MNNLRKNKKFKKIVLCSILTIFTIAVLYGITFYFSFFQGKTYVQDGIVKSKIKPISYESIYKEKVSLDTCKVLKVNNVKISILGKEIPKDVPILLRGQRYYLPLNYLRKILNYKELNNNELTLTNYSNTIILSEKQAIINNKRYNLRGWLLDYEKNYYLSLSDIEYLFSLTSVFDFKNKTVNLLKSNLKKVNTTESHLKDGPAALIRLEDFSSGGALYEDINQTKLKALGDYLYSNKIRFHIAWVPRYKDPSNKIDNDLLIDNTINNVGFINLIDYLINSGAEVGLHGYTHQYGNSTSLSGIELSNKFNNNEKSTRDVIENGLFTANKLNIPVYFFESPHYQATRKQKKIIEEYFKYLFEPYSVLYYTALKETSKGNVYIPAPLGYVKNRDTSSITKRLKNPSPNLLAALFYHPVLELQYISFSDNKNTFNWILSKDSLMKSIVSSLNENGYSTIHVTDIK